MDKLIRSLHHVTATVTDAQDDLDFYAGLLGQRLVKKTVNFDNHHVYHFYYGNETGTPGTIWTTFPYKGMGVRQGVHGAGQITTTSFSVPDGALPFWRQRLAATGVRFEIGHSVSGDATITFGDPSGLAVRLVGNSEDNRKPWTVDEIQPEQAVRGIYGVSLTVRDPALTIDFLKDLMDARTIHESDDGTAMGVGGSGPGHVVEVIPAGDAPPGINGLGTVHHVAFAVASDDDQLRMRDELLRRGVQVTPVLDREYFHSIYFREPNGVLFEIATIPPGFTVDEPLAELGRSLKLPAWEEPNRASIEAGLPAVTH
jgi:Lactoylglutathione lyase and related lyases